MHKHVIYFKNNKNFFFNISCAATNLATVAFGMTAETATPQNSKPYPIVLTDNVPFKRQCIKRSVASINALDRMQLATKFGLGDEWLREQALWGKEKSILTSATTFTPNPKQPLLLFASLSRAGTAHVSDGRCGNDTKTEHRSYHNQTATPLHTYNSLNTGEAILN